MNAPRQQLSNGSSGRSATTSQQPGAALGRSTGPGDAGGPRSGARIGLGSWANCEAGEEACFGIANQAPILLWLSDPVGRCTGANRRSLEFFGVAAAELAGQGWLERVHPDDRAAVAESFAEGLHAQREFSQECRILRYDGRWCWHLTTGRPVFHADGRFMGMAGACLDLGEHKRAEERAELLAGIVEQASEAVALIDSAGRLVESNAAFALMSGDAPDSPIERLQQWLAVDSPILLAAQAVTRGVPRRSGECCVESPGGRPRTLEYELFPLALPEADQDLVAVVLRDVTPQRDLEAQLRQAAKLETIGRLTGGVAHDFNNLLTTIMGCTEMAQMVVEPDSPLAEDLAQIAYAAERAASLTRQLLAVSRPHGSDARPLSVNAVVADMEQLLHRLIGEDIVLRTALRQDLPAVVAERTHLEQVLLNLAANARDAMPAGGVLQLATDLVELSPRVGSAQPALPPGSYVRMQVSDTGCGMAPELVRRIFEPFFSTKDAGRGTGLGLATVRGLVTQAGGAIECHSEAGSGTTFDVLLPASANDVTPAAADRLRRLSLGRGTVVLVEDEPGVMELARRALEHAGYRVLAAYDAQSALALAEANLAELRLVVADLVMPGESGTSLVQALRVRRPGLPALFITGYAAAGVALDLQADDASLLQKPFTPRQLVDVVQQILDRDV